MEEIRSSRHGHSLPLPSLILPLLLLLSSATPVAASEAAEDAAAISRFRQYLQINTSHPNPDYAGTTEFILSLARELALDSEVLEFVPGKPIVLLKWPGRDSCLPSVLLNSHTDVVPAEPLKWAHPPFSAEVEPETGRIYARGYMKCVGTQYLEAVRRLRAAGFKPQRTVYLSFVPDEEIGGRDGVGAFVASERFRGMRVGVVLDEGLASPDGEYRVFHGERSVWWMVVRASGAPDHGAKMYDNSAMENLMKSVEVIRRFRAAQFDLVKNGVKAEGEVISVNMVYLKAGTPSPTGFVMNMQPSEAEAGFDVRVPPIVDTEALERRIAEEWAPSSRNMKFEFKEKDSVHDMFGKPAATSADSSNPWWMLLVGAIKRANGKLSKPEIFPASTDCHFFRKKGLPAFGFSPMENTPILLHDHNEYLNKAEYVKGIGIYESIITAFASNGNHGSAGSRSSKSIKDELWACQVISYLGACLFNRILGTCMDQTGQHTIDQIRKTAGTPTISNPVRARVRQCGIILSIFTYMKLYT